MTAHLVIMSERTTDPDELQRYREKAPLAREERAVRSMAFDGSHEVLRRAEFAGGEAGDRRLSRHNRV